jgi:uncharacterized membrane protein
LSNRKVLVSIVMGLFLFFIGLICQFFHFFSRADWIWIYPYMPYVIPLITIGFTLIITGIVLSNVKYVSIDPD